MQQSLVHNLAPKGQDSSSRETSYLVSLAALLLHPLSSIDAATDSPHHVICT